METECELVVEAVAVRTLGVTAITTERMVGQGVRVMVMRMDGLRMVIGVMVGRGAHVRNW